MYTYIMFIFRCEELQVKHIHQMSESQCKQEVLVNKSLLWRHFEEKYIYEILFSMVCFVCAVFIVFNVWCVLVSLIVKVGCIQRLLYHP